MPQHSLDQPGSPRPGWLLIANSLLFVAAVLYVGSGMFGLAIWGWGLHHVVGGAGSGTLALAIAYLQYSATFRADRQSAHWLSIGLPCIAALALILLAIPVGARLPRGVSAAIAELYQLSGLLAIASWILFTAAINFRWGRQLAKTLGDDATPPPLPPFDIFTQRDRWPSRPPVGWRVRFTRCWIAVRRAISGWTLWRSAGLLAAMAVSVAGVKAGVSDIEPRRAMHVSPAEAHLVLPEGATDVCVQRGERNRIAYDFAIDEAGFRTWVASDEELVQVKAIENEVEIESCSDDPGKHVQPHVIQRGWKGSWHEEHSSDRQAYDSDAGRAYYSRGW